MAKREKHQHGNNYLERGRKMSSPRLGPVGGSDRVVDVSPFDGEPISGDGTDRWHNLKDRMTVMPVSIWPFPHDRHNRDLRQLVGDEGQLRADSFMGGQFLPSEHGPRANAASIFNPVLAAQLVAAYSQENDLIIDPFAGGGTRAVISAVMGRRYHGVDVREDEVKRVRMRLDELGLYGSLEEVAKADLTVDDAAQADWPSLGEKAHLLLTCPPYWNLEIYSDDPADLSTKPTYEEFLEGVSDVIHTSKGGLRQGALSVWVCGEFRHPETTELIDFPGDVARLHKKHGFWQYDRFVYTHANPQAFWRMGVFDKTRKVIRVHEHVLVMKWGGKVKPAAGKRSTRVQGEAYWAE